jgi:putative membrane protein
VALAGGWDPPRASTRGQPAAPAPRRARSGRRRTLGRAALLWAGNSFGLWISQEIFDGVVIEPLWRVITAGAVFGLVNWLVKPILRKLATPFIVITLGIALFFVNLAAVYIAAAISDGVDIKKFGGAVGTTIVLWFINVVLNSLFAMQDRRRARQLRRMR